MAAENITLIIPSAVAGSLLMAGGQFLYRLLTGKGDKTLPGKPAAAPCEGCPFHDDHEKRISDQEIRLRALEAHRARMEEAIPDIRNDLRDMKGMLNKLLLRSGGAIE